MNARGGGDAMKRQGTIHKVRELQLQEMCIEDHYDIIREIGAGDYGKVLLASHKKTNTQVSQPHPLMARDALDIASHLHLPKPSSFSNVNITEESCRHLTVISSHLHVQHELNPYRTCCVTKRKKDVFGKDVMHRIPWKPNLTNCENVIARGCCLVASSVFEAKY